MHFPTIKILMIKKMLFKLLKTRNKRDTPKYLSARRARM